MNTFFNARDLWAAQGCPYIEPDIVQQAFIPPVIRTMIFCGFWQGQSALAFDAEVVAGE